MFSRQQLYELWNSDDLIGLGAAADTVRKRLHPSNIVTYTRGADQAIITRAFRTGESFEERVHALEEINATDDVVAFRPTVEPSATGMQYLETLALSRIIAGKVLHIQASYELFGLKVAQLALRFGADDLGITNGQVTEEEMRRLIRDAGFVPKQRDALFRSYSLI
ncbi:MAG TPA: hypothetical protein VH302_08775 [Bryobacteraceae bacterium]|jgi:cyclic dehypoxanthinyl futalosine synthase|nr:hypothetical protein [Bryobacteraceae bacterium]